MTDSTPSKAVAVPKGGKDAKAKKPEKKPAKNKKSLFAGENITVDIVDEVAEKARMQRILRVVQMQIIVICAMTTFLVFASPFFQTIYQYYAVDSSDASHHTTKLVYLDAPNMTNQAILSWAADSITEIMTFGFGDYMEHLRKQKVRFTPDGWKSFVIAFSRMKLGEIFLERQLVLTTVPADAAVIKSQSFNLVDNEYEWKVQMPVVMTYATNDNVTQRSRALIELVIERVSPLDNPHGIAIKSWTVGNGGG